MPSMPPVATGLNKADGVKCCKMLTRSNSGCDMLRSPRHVRVINLHEELCVIIRMIIVGR